MIYDKYIKDDGTLFRRLLNYRNQLARATEFEFVAFANNFVEIINQEVPEECTVNYGTSFTNESRYFIQGEPVTAVEAIQISENYFSLFPMTVTTGRCFESSDFGIQNSEFIPIVMGGSYSELYHIGDTFEGYYICERRKFKVIGFTDNESVFYLSSKNSLESYKNYIIMPFENPIDDTFYARAVQLQQICGFVIPQTNRDTTLQAIHDCLQNAGLPEWADAIVVNEKCLRKKLN